jgi:integrase
VLLAGDAGLRLGEVVALRPKDLDFRNRVVHVNTTVWHGQRTLPKGGEPRSLPMSNRLLAAVQGLDLSRPDLINRDSSHGQGQCTPDAIANLIERAARLASLGHISKSI